MDATLAVTTLAVTVPVEREVTLKEPAMRFTAFTVVASTIPLGPAAVIVGAFIEAAITC
jgi:hypothetical protein